MNQLFVVDQAQQPLLSRKWKDAVSLEKCLEIGQLSNYSSIQDGGFTIVFRKYASILFIIVLDFSVVLIFYLE
jgi:hypothetical protein